MQESLSKGGDLSEIERFLYNNEIKISKDDTIKPVLCWILRTHDMPRFQTRLTPLS